jgi:Flp pilus assembly protein TadD
VAAEAQFKLRGGLVVKSGLYDAVSRLAALSFVSLLLACTNTNTYSPDLGILEPLQQGDRQLSVADAEILAPTPDLLALSDEMKDFADRYVMTANSPRQRMHMLHRSLRSNALLGIEYDPEADGTAAQAFARGRANGLTYTHLFISMARYAGLDARYQSLTLRPEWARFGTRVSLRLHVNVLVRLRRNEHYMVDIDPVQRDTVADSRLLGDEEAFALHHNNLAMARLREEKIGGAYAQAVKAVSLSPGTDYLWVNLGVIYKRAGQAAAAENSYLTAIDLNPDSRSAMNNLVLMHSESGNTERADYWERQVIKHRQRNPYYYIYLGEKAEEAGDYQAAIAHYRTAIKRKDSDAEFYFRLAKLYLTLEQRRRSIHFAQEAIERSRMAGEREEYQAFLDRIEGRSLAQLR